MRRNAMQVEFRLVSAIAILLCESRRYYEMPVSTNKTGWTEINLYYVLSSHSLFIRVIYIYADLMSESANT